MPSLIEQLNKIDIQARAEWKKETRIFLLSQIRQAKLANLKMAPKNNQNMKRAWAELASALKSIRLAWRPVGILAIWFLFFVLGSGVLVAIAHKAVPGERMFIVKRMIEKSEVFLATSNAQEAELASAFLGNRVDELEKIMWQKSKLVATNRQHNNYNKLKANQTQNIILAVEEVNKQLDEVNSRVKKLKNNGQQAGVTAMMLNQKINNYKMELKQVKKGISNKQVAIKLDQTLNRVGDLNGNLLAVIVDKQQKGELKLTTKEIEKKLTDHLSEIEQKTEEVKQKVDRTNLFKDDKAMEIKDKTKIVEKNINIAHQAIKKDNFKLVLTLAKDSNKILEMLYGDIYKIIDNSQSTVAKEKGTVKGAEIKKDMAKKQEVNSGDSLQVDETANLDSTSSSVELKTKQNRQHSDKKQANQSVKTSNELEGKIQQNKNNADQLNNNVTQPSATRAEFEVGIQ